MKILNIDQKNITNKSDLTFLYLQKCFDLIDKDKGNKLIDLACGNGSYSILAHKNGFDVTGIDARTERIPLENKQIKWIQNDIKNMNLEGFDVIIASGILYHLPLKEQIILLKKVKECYCKYLIINTHFAIFDKENNPVNKNFKHLLSKKQNENGIKGAIYAEGCLNNLKSRPMAAISNETSFWATYNSLLEMITNTEMNITILEPLLFEDRVFLFCERYENKKLKI